MKKLLLGAGALMCVSSAAVAGPNTGILAVIQAEGVVYTSDIDDYCGASSLPSCEQAVSSYNGTDTIVLNTVAFFVGAPRLAGTIFGIEYPETDLFIVDFGACGDFELTTNGWPASGEGTAVTWGTAQTTLATQIYWFAGYNYYGNSISFDLTLHPNGGGAAFADDDVPSNVDQAVALGSFGFGGNPGDVPCIVNTVGACCDRCGECTIVTRDECEDVGSDYLGDDTLCDPSPCAIFLGACCFDDGSCQYLNICDCEDAGGDFKGVEIPCDPDPCVIVPTVDASWGQLKGVYR